MNSTLSKLELSKSKNMSQNNDYSFGYFIPNKLQRLMILIGKKTILKRGLFRSKYAKFIMSLSKGPLDSDIINLAYFDLNKPLFNIVFFPINIITL